MSERKGGMIILGIIAISALGFSGYMFIDDMFLSSSIPEKGLVLIGLWDDLVENKEYAPYTADNSWLIEFSNSQYNNSNHISVSNNNTSFKLMKEGFYRITLLLMWYNLDPSGIYWAYLYRNNTYDHCFDRVSISANPSSVYYQVTSSVYVKSTGYDDFFIRCYASGDTSFDITVSQAFNQLSIEYNQ